MQTVALTDKQLVLDLRAGDKKAFALLYERYRASVLAYCSRILNDAEDAEDVVQDVFIKARDGIASLTDGMLCKHWLFRIARNEALMKIRRRHPTQQIEDDTAWETDTPMDHLERLEATAIVRQLLKDLKFEYREVLVLREYGGLSYSAIAEIVGVSTDVVRVRIYRARSSMTEKLKRFYG